MNRRSFLKYIGIGLASLPFVGRAANAKSEKVIKIDGCHACPYKSPQGYWCNANVSIDIIEHVRAKTLPYNCPLDYNEIP